ncbi:MAG: endopeptidase IV [Coxiella sp. RIFCSPHIGHO2_12_FULL_44_14]|nr:MAG: endopeptidase IV [Coxiella sp. RIFCSPHIGHO2_12_FULL_44_14]
MKKWILSTVLLFSLTSLFAEKEKAPPSSPYYGVGLCGKPGYDCIKVKGGESWEKLFPNEQQRDVVQRLNRSNTYLHAGKTLAVPKNLSQLTLFDISPFPNHIEKRNDKIIIVDQNLLAWGAYNADGDLVKWGPISSGKDYCPDVHRACKTITGVYYVFHKKDKKCRSNIFPVGRGGSIMPFCMFFFKGYALHGSNEVYGFRDSHGCVRLFTEDAEWLNKDFVDPATKEGYVGTKVVIQRLKEDT